MSRKAVCIGINDYPGDEFDLGGCVKDARAWAELLINRFNFERRGVKLILDREATKDNILRSLNELLLGARSGDVRVFIYSGHGSWIPDTGVKDEEDGRDEVLVPCEADFNNLIIDDELRQRLDSVPRGVNLTVICDSCHSGTVTRLWPGRRAGDRPSRRSRFYPPPPDFLKRVAANSPIKRRLWARSEESMPELLLSAARSGDEAAEDVLEGEARGVFSFYAIRVLESEGPELSYSEWIKLIQKAIPKGEFSQLPQLEGRAMNKGRKVFSPFVTA